MKKYALTWGDLGSRKTAEKLQCDCRQEAIVLLCNELSPKWENGRGLTRAGRAEQFHCGIIPSPKFVYEAQLA